MNISHDDEDFAPLITKDMPSQSPPAENNWRKEYFNMVFCLAFGVVLFMVVESSKFFHLAIQKETLYTNASIDGSDDANDDRKQNQTKSTTAKPWEEPQVKATLKPTQVTEVIPESMNANPSPVPTLVAPKPKPWTTDRTWEGAVAKIVGLTPVYNSSQANHPNCAQLCKHLREKKFILNDKWTHQCRFMTIHTFLVANWPVVLVEPVMVCWRILEANDWLHGPKEILPSLRIAVLMRL